MMIYGILYPISFQEIDINGLLNNIQHMLTSNEDLNIFPCTFYFNIVIMSRGAGSSVRILNIAENSITKKY
jgi:hypothetical protein